MPSTTVMENLNFALGVGGAIIGVLGLVYAWIVQPRKRLTYSKTGIRLIGLSDSALPESIKVLHGGKEVTTLTLSDVLIWNSGNQTILPTEVVDTNRLRVEVSDGAKILEVQEASATRKDISLNVEINPADPRQLFIGFRFLDATDGMRLKILHTDKSTDPKVLGTITGIPTGIRDHGAYTSLESQRTIVKWTRRCFIVLALWWLFELFRPSIYVAFPFLLRAQSWKANFDATWFPNSPEQVNYFHLGLTTLIMMYVGWYLWKYAVNYPKTVVEKLSNSKSGATDAPQVSRD